MIYYVTSSEVGLINALFEDNLSVSSQRRALTIQIFQASDQYKDFIFTGEETELTSFFNLIGVPFEAKVAKTDYAQIQAIIKTAWSQTASGQ